MPQRINPHLCLSALSTGLAVLLFAAPARSQQVEAVTGAPFGVAEVTLPFPAEDVGLPAGRASFVVENEQGRVFYPAVTSGVLRRILGGGAPPPRNVTVTFLFQGNTPFEVTIGTPTRQRVQVNPTSRRGPVYTRILRRWWRSYHAMLGDLSGDSGVPPVLEAYLTSMLARRLQLDEPLLARLAEDARKSEGRQTLEILSGAESIRGEVFRAAALGTLPSLQEANLPLPPGVSWHSAELPVVANDVDIEPMAMRVPEECFYVRFGLYSNFLWLNALMQDYGGNIGNMLAERGYETQVNQRVQDQLALKQGVLAELLGPQTIADFALIGLDTFTREGAALGVVFEARGSLLGGDLVRQRQEALLRQQDNGATLTTVRIAEREVSFLSTPDNQLRSYYLVDGNYHLVTNSHVIVERFLEVAKGQGGLGANAEFRYARSVVPTSRDDTIFAYFSSAFFRNLLSPHYQVELGRRMRAAAEIELMQLAQLAARAEGVPADGKDELVRAQLLPASFDRRPDGSQVVVTPQGLNDSLRGTRGFFMPVPDMTIAGISAAEREHYLTLASYYAENWKQVDPVLVAMKRFALDQPGQERIVMDAFVTPMDNFKYEVLMSALGEPSAHRLVPPDNTIVLIDAAVRGGMMFPSVPPHRLLLGIQDRPPLSQPGQAEILRFLQIVRTVPGYLGAWPKPGFLDVLPLGFAAPPDQDGFSDLPLGLTRWQGRGFSVLALERSILEDVSQQLGFVEEDDPAHVRVEVGDLSRSQFREWLNALGYERARQISVANAQFLGVLTQQLKVAPADALQVAQQLLAAQLICTLGGQYQLVSHGAAEVWQSTAWPTEANYEVPPDYVTPPLDWFRGLQARLVKYPDRLVLRAQVDLQRKERTPMFQLPFFRKSDAAGSENQQDATRDDGD